MQTLVSLFLCNHSSKLNLTTVRKSPVSDFVVGLISFPIAWILDTVNKVLLYYFFQFGFKMAVHAACKEKNMWSELLLVPFKKELISFWCFSRRVSFPFKCGKAIFCRSRRLASQKFTLLVNHGHASRRYLHCFFPITFSPVTYSLVI